jgi:hypothetical protein
MAIEKVTVAVADDYQDRFSEVVERSKKAGLDVDQQLQTVGVVTGSIDADKVKDLEQVEGVAAVESARRIQLPPPDSDVQ